MAKTPTKPIRISPELWDAAGDAAAKATPPTDRSALAREFFAWYARLPGAKMPKRPPLDTQGDGAQSAGSPQDDQ
ncbi:hypothetical protein ACIQWR_28635 [Streptomyces sp. NPDC098789]|uniref:hypothetical protein n=1 Tax=Streptomyces sp. NPDC098789 TaxID=3366098 RepID=UPI00381577D4